MDFAALQTELTTDPLTRGYSGMSHAQAAADLSTVYRTRDKPTLTGIEVRNAVDAAEWTALSDANKQMALILFTAAELDAATNGPDDRLISNIFGAASTTRNNLATVRQENVSRIAELDIGFGNEVTAGQVERARSL